MYGRMYIQEQKLLECEWENVWIMFSNYALLVSWLSFISGYWDVNFTFTGNQSTGQHIL